MTVFGAIVAVTAASGTIVDLVLRSRRPAVEPVPPAFGVAGPARHRATAPVDVADPAQASLPPHDPAPAESRFTIRVIGSGATIAPLGGAEVTLFSSSGEVVGGALTDSGGNCTLALTEEPVDLAVRRRGFATFSGAIAGLLRRADGGFDVQLAPAGPVRGTVRLPGGAAPAQPVRVAAWPRHDGDFDAVAADRAAREDPRLLTAMSDAGGEFEILGVPEGAEVALVAAGDGLVQVGTAWARSGGEPAHVIVAPLYVLDVTTVDSATGAPTHAMPCVGPAGLSGYRARTDTLATVPAATATLRWAGVSPVDPDAVGGGQRTYIAFAADVESDRYGPFVFHASVPGYEPERLDVWALRARAGADLRQVIRLRQQCAGFGVIEIRAQGLDDAVRARWQAIERVAGRHSMCLQIESVESGAQFAIDLRSLARGPVTVPGVPAGRYRAAVRVPLGSARICGRAHELQVDPHRHADLVLDLGGCTIVEIRPEVGPATGFDGYLSVIVTLAGDSRGGNWSFDGPPYAILGMAGGAYEFRAMDRSGPGTWKPVSATIVEGAVTVVDLPRR